MELSLTKLPWYGQIGAFVLVCAGAVFGFWNFYVPEVQTDIALRQTHLTALRADINKGVATARRLPEFQAQVTELERQLESLRNVLPEQKDVADTLRRIQGLATQSNLTLLALHAGAAEAAAALCRGAVSDYPPRARTTTSALFFDRVSKFPRIINVSDISIRAKRAAAAELDDHRRRAPRRRSCCRKRGQGRARRAARPDDASSPLRRRRDRRRTLAAAQAVPLQPGPAAQAPQPPAAIAAAKAAAAQVDAAHQKNAEALDQPRRRRSRRAAQPPPQPAARDGAAAGCSRQPAQPPRAAGVRLHLRPGRSARSVREPARSRGSDMRRPAPCGRQGCPGSWSAN